MKRILTLCLLSYLRIFARLAISMHKPFIIGIAGSVGKSSTRNALYGLLKEYYPTKMVYGNSETGIPLGILGIHQSGFSPINWFTSMCKAPFGLWYLQNTKYLVVEMGIDEPFPPKNMSYLLTIVDPDIAISLNVSATHTQQFEKLLKKGQQFSSEKEKLAFLIGKIAEEDTKIITQSHSHIGIYNHDDLSIKEALKKVLGQKTKKQIISFGKKPTNTISYESYDVSMKGTTFSFTFHDSQELLTLSFPNLILPQEYQELLSAVILVGNCLQLSHKQIKFALEKNLELPLGRGSIFSGIKNSLIIDSSYNASKEAVIAFLDLTKQLKKETNRPVIFLFGDMRELGNESKIEHEEVAKHICGIADYLFCIGPQTKQYVLPIVKKSIPNTQWFPTSIDAGKYLQEEMIEDAIVLVKGSQNTLFLEEGIKYILKHKQDKKKLCRQEKYWLEMKEKYFNEQCEDAVFLLEE